jgi:hypothetical protein
MSWEGWRRARFNGVPGKLITPPLRIVRRSQKQKRPEEFDRSPGAFRILSMRQTPGF